MSRASVRMVIVTVIGMLAVLLWGGPASAHTEIKIDNPQGGATNVTMAVTAEAENDSAGITSVRMQLPAGITPNQVSLSNGPPGWTLTAEADGFTASGAPLPAKTDAKFAVKLAQLPPAGGVLAFKSLVTYTDGKVDRWIEEATASDPAPKAPAPTVSVRPGVVTTSPSSTTTTPSAAGSAGLAASAPSTSPASATSSGGSGGNGLVWLIIVIVGLVLAALAAGLVWRRRRGAAQ